MYPFVTISALEIYISRISISIRCFEIISISSLVRELIEMIPKQLADIDLRQINIYQCTNSIDPHISESIPPRPLGTKTT